MNAQLTTVGQQRVLRDVARRALERRQRGLIDELSQLLEDDDPRWLSFGLNPPGADETTAPPDNVSAVPGLTPGSVFVDFDDVPNADHYRLFKLVVGVDPDFLPAATVTESEGTITGLPTGPTIRIRVTAVNGSLESQPSAAFEIILPTGP